MRKLEIHKGFLRFRASPRRKIARHPLSSDLISVSYKKKSDIDLAFTGGRRGDKARFTLDVDEETSTLLSFDIVDLDGPVSEELRESIRREGVVIYEKV